MLLPPSVLKALEAFYPAYFDLPEPQQHTWRLHKSDRLRKRMLTHFMRHDLGLTEKEIRKAARERYTLTPEQTERLNYLALHIDGFGQDFFYLNEFSDKDLTVQTWGTIRAYAEDDHDFQVMACAEEFNTEKTPFRGGMHSTWARCLFEGKLAYLNLSMLSSYLVDFAEERFRGLMDYHIPHEYVEGEDHMKKLHGGIQWDMRIQAFGKEALYDAMTKASYAYFRDRRKELDEHFHQKEKGVVWLVPTQESPIETNFAVVFSNSAAMDVRFSNFLADCKAREGSAYALKVHIAEEVKKLDFWFFTTLAALSETPNA